MTDVDREGVAHIAKRLETVPGAADANTASRHVLRMLDAVERLAEGLADVWAAVGGEDWDRAKAEVAVADYRAPEVPTANWGHRQSLTPLSPDALEAIRGGNGAQPNMAVTALLDEVDRLAWEVRTWRFNYDSAKRNEQAVREHAKSSAASANATLARVWGLLNRQRKTVAMDALREALQPTRPAGIADTPDTTRGAQS